MNIYYGKIHEATSDELRDVAGKLLVIGELVNRYIVVRGGLNSVYNYWTQVVSNVISPDVVNLYLNRLKSLVEKVDSLVVGVFPSLSEDVLEAISDSFEILVDGIDDIIQSTREAEASNYDVLSGCMKQVNQVSRALDDLIRSVNILKNGGVDKDEKGKEKQMSDSLRNASRWYLYPWRIPEVFTEAKKKSSEPSLPPQLERILPHLRELKAVLLEITKYQEILNDLSKKRDDLREVILPVLHQLGMNRVQVDDVFIVLTEYDRNVFKYKEILDGLFSKLTDEQRTILEQLKQTYSSVSHVSTIKVEPRVSEQAEGKSWLRRLWDMFKGLLSKITGRVAKSKSIVDKIKSVLKGGVKSESYDDDLSEAFSDIYNGDRVNYVIRRLLG